MNGVDAMPVRIKPEPHDGLVPRSAPQPPPPPVASATNGSSAAHRPSPYHPQSQNGGPGPVRASSTSSASSHHGGGPPGAPATNGVGKEKEAAPVVSEDAVDYDSVRGVFGWATLDGINVPYIIRKYRKFVAVRIVEKKMLSKYPNSFPDELGKKDPLISYFVTEAEAKLLNEINVIHCSYEYGQQPFSTKDLIVDLTEFEEFYKLVKKTFPDEVLATMGAEENGSSPVDDKKAELSKVCGWMQINNTVTPYIVRSSGKFVPLSVILYAAQLLTKEHVEGNLPTEEECRLLNTTCQAAGFDFTFGKNTRLIHISEVLRRCQVRIFELPFDNPLQHAQYIDSLQQAELSGIHPPPVAPSVAPGNMSLPFQSKPVVSEGPPNYNPFPYNPFVSMANMMSQPPSSVPRHRSAQTASSMAMSAATQLVRTQNAPIFFPPAPPSSVSRGLQSNSLPTVPQPPGMVPAHQRQSFSGMGPTRASPSPQAGSPHARLGSPSGLPASHPSASHAPGFPSQMMHGAPGAPGRFQYPANPASCPSGIPRLPPPYLPPHPHQHLMQRPGQPPMSGPPIPGPHPFMRPPPPHFTGQEGEVMVPGVGPVPRGAVPMMGYPPPHGLPGGLPPQMSLPHPPDQPPHLAHAPPCPPQQPTLPPNHFQAHPQSSSRPLTQPMVPQQMPRSSPGSMLHTAKNSPSGVSAVPPPCGVTTPSVYPVQPAVFPVQLSPAAARLPGSNPAAVAESQHQSKASVQPAPDDHLKLVANIKAVMSHGKSISCMRRDSPERKGNFCLVEAVAKLYFPKCSLAEFVNALRNVLQINLPVCTETEAKAFIHFYNLPVTTLNDNHMIDLDDLNSYFPQISYMFRHASADLSSVQAGKVPVMNTSRRSNGVDATTRMASPSAPITIVLNNNDSAEVISIDSGPPTPINDSTTTKRRLGEESGGSGTKVKRRSSTSTADEVDGSSGGAGKTVIVSAPVASSSNTKPSATTSQVIVID